MHISKHLTLILSGALLGATTLFTACQNVTPSASTTSQVKDVLSEPLPNDTTQTTIHRLSNGLTVYLSPNTRTPRIQTYIAFNVGSKNDPEQFTGLAHYMEHLLFKGSDEFGTIDYAKEKPLIDKIAQLFDAHRQETDPAKKAEIYKEIDRLSVEAAAFAIPNEYDKLCSLIGATGTNAYTSFDQTVYINDIPANQLENWLYIETSRLRNPVFRQFHTELETVYEEKNISLDKDSRKMLQAMMETLFPNHPYGSHPVLGTMEDLKNPSINAVQDFYDKYYIPANMALCLSGDFDKADVLAKLEASLGTLPAQRHEVMATVMPIERPAFTPLAENKEVTVKGREAAMTWLGFPLKGAEDVKTTDLLLMCDMILTNGQAGLIDLNLNQKQRLLQAFSSPLTLQERSVLMMGGLPIEGQTLQDVRDLLLAQLDHLKSGNFADWLPAAVVTDLRLRTLQELQTNKGRTSLMTDAFIYGLDWQAVIARLDRLEKLTKEEITAFARENFVNYVTIYKEQDPNLEKFSMQKPEISQIPINRQASSAFLKRVAKRQVEPMKPVFVDFHSAVKRTAFNGLDLRTVENEENELFSLQLSFHGGQQHDLLNPLTGDLFSFFSTPEYSSQGIKEALYRIGCQINVGTDKDTYSINISGLTSHLPEVLALLNRIVANPQLDDNDLNRLKARIMQARKDERSNRKTIFWQAAFKFARFGEINGFTARLSDQQLATVTTQQVIDRFKAILQSPKRISYYGPESAEQLTDELNVLNWLKTGHSEPIKQFAFNEVQIDQPGIYFINYPIQQADILFLASQEKFNPDNQVQRVMFNEYFGGNMSSPVFQQIREARGLAYTTFSGYSTPSEKDKRHWFYAYLGTQADKMPEAIDAMFELIHEFPASPVHFNNTVQAMKSQLEASRTLPEQWLAKLDSYEKLGIKQNPSETLYQGLDALTMDELQAFHKEKVASRPYQIWILGDRERLDLDALKAYGPIHELTLEQIFGIK